MLTTTLGSRDHYQTHFQTEKQRSRKIKAFTQNHTVVSAGGRIQTQEGLFWKKIH